MKQPSSLFPSRHLLAPAFGMVAAIGFVTAAQAQGQCSAQSGAERIPVIELYTSEGCSSCPPADQWASKLKDKPAVVEAFHVDYWNYIGWVDRFSSAANTQRQRQIASQNNLGSIYTPQVVRDGQDWPRWRGGVESSGPARATLAMQQTGDNQFEAEVTPQGGAETPWAAYWTVTENGHSSNVKAGENSGELLKHDFVVRQYTPVGDYKGAAKLSFRSIAADPAHPRRINLVVFDPKDGTPLQALSLACAG